MVTSRWAKPCGAWSLLLVGCLFAAQAMAAPVSAQLDRTELVEGETAMLVLQTNDPQQSLETDLSALESDFQIIDRRSETQMSIVNGRQAAVVRMLLTLEPRRDGQLVIPPLAFEGGSRTAPITVNVSPAPELAPGEAAPVFIEVELDPQEGPYYVHAQLSLKVRIFYQQNLTEAAINPPAPAQASVRLLDEVPYQADRNGQQYRVLERRYAVFPERSGELVIPPMQLTGRLIERPADRLWQPSVRGRRVRIESDPITLDISPRPADFAGPNWLPARRIDLSQQITDGDSIRVGEPVTRTIILDAVGLEEHMLEQPEWPDMPNARIYPDQPQGISRDDGQWVLGHREFRYAVVPETDGTLVLPELQLYWWDTVANRQRVAILPEHRVTVLPSTLAASQPVNPSGSGATGLDDARGPDPIAERWRWLAGLFAVLWLGTGILWLRERSRTPTAEAGRAPEDQDEAALLRQIKQACNAGDPVATRAGLGRWLRRYGPPAGRDGLMGLAARLGDHELAREIRRFDEARFSGNNDGSWDGAALWVSFDAWRGQPVTARENAAGALDLYATARSA